jgi:acyl-coenzyme A synthetase/AMP-(fatty) acid ligase/acyl carrier protein
MTLVAENLVRAIALNRVTHAVLPPAVVAALPEGADLASIETLAFAGSRLSEEVMRRWVSGHRLINVYGPTESTVCASLYQCRANEGGAPPIGCPIPNVQIFVADPGGTLLPRGTVGELYIGGPGVARGYLNRPGPTAERFVPDAFADQPGARLYRTGDRGRRLDTRTFDLLGRPDFQVKVRGNRIELSEVERALVAQPGVKTAVVVASADVAEDRRLVAYVVLHQLSVASRDATSSSTLREALRREFPRYMVPSAIVILDSLPLTASGEVDRDSLSVREMVFEAAVNPPARTDKTLLRAVHAIWSDVLGVPSIESDVSFFDVGGDSFLLVKLHQRVKATFNVPLSLVDLFRYTTIAALANYLGNTPMTTAEAMPDALEGHTWTRLQS